MTKPNDDPLFVGSLEKAMRVLHAFAERGGDFGMTELVKATGLNKSAVQRFTHTLVQLGYLKRDAQTRRLSPGIRLLDFSYAYLAQDRLAELAMPRLIDLSRQVGKRVNLVERDGIDIVYTARIPVENQNYSALVVGRRLPMYCTSGGVALLSRLSDEEIDAILDASTLRSFAPQTLTTREAVWDAVHMARNNQCAILAESIVPGEITVSAPIIDAEDRPVGAVQMSTAYPEYDRERTLAELAPHAIATARSLSREKLYVGTEG